MDQRVNHKIAIMQPYIFPYLGYFQLIEAVNTFVFYDDVNFIKRGWINRNRILLGGKEHMFTVPLIKASQNKLINETKVQKNSNWIAPFLTTLKQAYHKAAYYDDTMALVESIVNAPHVTIADLAINSVIKISDHIKLTRIFELSSIQYFDTKGESKADRLISITLKNGCNHYINPAGGIELYDKAYFLDKGVKLSFIENELVPYSQFNYDTFLGLSIIDILMFNSTEKIREMLKNYKLI